MKWEAYGATDRGRVRRRNEDSLLVRPDAGVFAVADGMGGHAAGHVASAMAIRTIEAVVDNGLEPGADAGALLETLVAAVHDANRAILESAATDPARSGMGTTMTVLALMPDGDRCVLAHVGDSRAYLWRDRTLSQLTVDHTWVQRQVELGRLTPSQARVHPYSSMLTNALGVAEEDRVDGLERPTRPGDLYLLCTDGLSGVLEDEQLEMLLGEDRPLEGLAAELISATNEAGGPDNITVVLVRVTG